MRLSCGLLLKAASCGCGAAIIVIGVISLVTLSLDIPGAVRNAYFVVFGVLLIVAEFSHVAKVQWMLKYLSMLTTFTGAARRRVPLTGLCFSLVMVLSHQSLLLGCCSGCAPCPSGHLFSACSTGAYEG